MNGKQLGLLVGLLVLLGGAGLLVQHSRNQVNQTSTPGAGGKLLGDDFPINDVAHIRIRQDTNELNLVYQNDRWGVRERDNYPASFSLISDFLKKANDLKIVERDAVSPDDLRALQLAPPGQGTNSGIVLDLLDKNDKSIRSLVLGKSHSHKVAAGAAAGEEGGFADGRYLIVGGDTQNVVLVADALAEIDPKPSAWLDKDFFKVERPKALSVSYPAATNSWKVSRDLESGNWKLLDPAPGENVDSNKVAGVSNPFTSPSFDDVLAINTKPADVGLDKPTVVTVDTFDDITYTAKLGTKNGDDVPLSLEVSESFPKERTPLPGEKPEDKDKADKAWQDQQKLLHEKFKEAKAFENRIFLVPGWNLDSFVKDRKDLMVDKKDDAKGADAGADTNLAPTLPLTLPTNLPAN